MLTDNGVQFTPRKQDIWDSEHIFDRVYDEHDIEHRLAKPYHPWTNGQAERMNRTIKDATTKAFHYPDLDVEVPLDPATLTAAIATLRAENVDAVAISLLHAWRDGTHERAAGEAIQAALPNVYVTLSSEVLPQIKEVERFSTMPVTPRSAPSSAATSAACSSGSTRPASTARSSSSSPIAASRQWRSVSA